MIEVTGVAAPPPEDGTVRWAAAAPAAFGYSFSGTGLPHPSERAAFDGGLSFRGTVRTAADGSYGIALPAAPGSYYVLEDAAARRHPRPPQVHVEWSVGGVTRHDTIELPAETAPFRSLAAPCAGARQPDYGETQEARLRGAAWRGRLGSEGVESGGWAP